MRVLMAYDGGEPGERALKAIAGWAEATNAELHLVTVIKPGDVRETSRGDFFHSLTPVATSTGQILSSGEPLPRLAEDRSQAVAVAIDEASEALAAAAARLVPGVNVTVHAEIDDQVAEAIISLADRIQAELIAVGTHGRKGLSNAIMGSVAQKVVRQSPRPVLVVGPSVQLAGEVSEPE